MAEFKYEIIKTIGVLSEGSKGWRKELNLISWNDKPPKYDIREWSPDRQKMGKGVTLSEEELKELKKLLDELN
ncbi:seryl-tRNA synthetase [Desulforamulus profundi]|uniref:Seryl-tRNA synthetase n=1 Tax=Desulforamulus profundi TaxID=1383067 RepID=A0A2C6M5P1_9FIRM|nr:PC4/YdbC family ssDNA-binding protein [Desulforamulus profundi]PHJ37537.1 seryl-tRNA synthetase [Desulforamulus profundi]